MKEYTPLKCDICGGGLILDDSREFAVCEYCGTKYKKSVLQQKILEITGTVTVEGNVTVRQMDFQVRGGVLEEFNGVGVEAAIPDTVYIIGRKTFKDCRGLRKVIIPDTVTEIESQAFSGCRNLQSIVLSQNIQKWGSEVFKDCVSLQSVIIPRGIKQLGDAIFENCANLKSVRLPEGIVKIGCRAFNNCKQLQNINFPSTLRKIDQEAFRFCKDLQFITLPDGIEIIGESAFIGSGLREINIPESVRIISEYPKNREGYLYTGAFQGCADLENVTGNFEPFLESFKFTPFRTNYLQSKGLCQHCGGRFKGVFHRICSECGEPKDY